MPEIKSGTSTWTSSTVFRVYEHDVLRVGEQYDGIPFSTQHLESLAELSIRLGQRYFTLGHRSVRFRHYVGILATPALTVEILPKADRESDSEDPLWQQILVDLLRACYFIRPESSGFATVAARPGALLDWYIEVFMEELQRLLHHGLLHQYQKNAAELGTLKGRLNLPRQLRRNLIHRERFHVVYDQYSDRHPANLTIGAALKMLLNLPLANGLRSRLVYLSNCFPTPQTDELQFLRQPELLHRDPRLERYATALSMAHHILQDERPEVQAGPYRGLSLLFDMNQLFETYLYRQLCRWKEAGMQLERQQSTVFWGQNRLRPDLVLASSGKRWVLDTKWKILPSLQPSADELRQIYVYCDYFEAKRGVLIYPHTGREPATFREPFAPLSVSGQQNRICQLYFARVVTAEGRLNRELGKELLEELQKSE